MKTLLRLWPYFRPNLNLTIGAYLCVIAQAVFTLLVPSLLGLAVDRGVDKRDIHQLVLLSGLILLFSALRGIFAFGQGYLGESSAQGVSYQLRKSLYSHIQKLSFSFHDQAQTGELMARATSDVEQLRLFTGRGLLMIFNVLLLMAGVAIAMLRSSWVLALLSVAVLPMLVYRSSVFSRRIRPMYRQIQNQIAAVSALIQENAAGARVVKAFGRERQESERFDVENERLFDRYISAARQMAFNAPLLDFMSNTSTLAMLWVCGFLLIHRLITFGALVAFYAYLLQLVAPIRRGGWLMAMASRAAASAERIFEILDAPVTVDSHPSAIELPSVRGRVEFRDVSCAYHPGRSVLEHVSFVAEPGQTIALVGTTGSGKTSIANLIPRFYDVTSGQVLIDDHDVREVTLASLRRQVGIVMQETTLFSGTIRENLSFGRPDASQRTIREAARAARADEFIERLPDGYDTVVGERGVSLSGGQKQRIAIARALVLDPRLLILDEFTSAVDVATERLIRAALLELLHGRTTFVIAHRISTVRAANVILVLSRGRLVATGTHEQLLESSAEYRQIHASQLVDPEAKAAGVFEGEPEAAAQADVDAGPDRERVR